MIQNVRLGLSLARGRPACCHLCVRVLQVRGACVPSATITRNIESREYLTNHSGKPSDLFSTTGTCTRRLDEQNVNSYQRDVSHVNSIYQASPKRQVLPKFLCQSVLPSPIPVLLPRQRPRNSHLPCALKGSFLEQSLQQTLHDCHLPFVPKRHFSLSSHRNSPGRGTLHWSSTQSGEDNQEVLELCEALLAQERWALAKAITLVEATHKRGKREAQVLLRKVLDYLRVKQAENRGIPRSFRIGLTGPPGAGKSTFIEALGKKLTAEGNRVAVLAVDPSSSITGGSILGDKTRMTELSRDPNAYIRASPSSGTLGGVTRNTNDTIVLCEAAGYDTIIVETVGVGQSEYVVADMVDMLVLMIPPAGGDELQGLKKGIVERADFILVNKADGELLIPARRIRAEYTSAVKLMYKRSPLWSPKVKRVSSKTLDGLDEAWNTMQEYRGIMQDAGELMRKREKQRRVWMWQHIQDHMMDSFRESTELIPEIMHWEQEVMAGRSTSGIAADELLKSFSKLHKKF